MKRSFLAGWTAFGFLSLSAVTVFGLPFVGSDRTDSALPATSPTTTVSITSTAMASVPSLLPVANQLTAQASARAAAAAAHCQEGVDGLERARVLVYYRNYEEAAEILDDLLGAACLDRAEDRDMGRFQAAYLHHLLESPERVVERLDEIETSVPVGDYVHWLRGDALYELERFDEAAPAFGAIFEAGDSPLHWRARARQAKSLVAAELWEDARPIVDELVDLFPDYPRRHRILYEQGQVYEALGDLETASLAYQRAFFEFPHKREGLAARERLAELAAEGVEPPAMDREVVYQRYRQLSIDKFWPMAHELLTELAEAHATEEGVSAFENQILQQIALNAYNSHDFEGAAEYFAQARAIFEAGHEDGFTRRTIYRWHSFSLARIGRHDEAIEALEALHANSPRRERLSDIAHHYERHGQYEEAYQLYEEVYTAAQQRGWHFSYLRYKTGRFEEAYESLRRLARNSRGERRAQYLYWAARSLERAGIDDDARALFTEIQQTRPTGYYGLQAANRLQDMDQRSNFDDTFFAQSDRLSEHADRALDNFDDPFQVPATGPARSAPDPRLEPLTTGVNGERNNELWDQNILAAILDGDCHTTYACAARWMGLPYSTEGLPWSLGRLGADRAAEEGSRRAPLSRSMLASTADEPVVEGLDYDGAPQARIPGGQRDFSDDVPRIRYTTEGRIYWHGRHGSDIAFVNFDRGQMLGPTPSDWTAYDDDTHHGGLHRAVDAAGDLFPNLERTLWLWQAGWGTEARRVVRDVALEFRSISNRARPTQRPHALPNDQSPYRRWAILIDNRRRNQRADLWGMTNSEPRFPIPSDRAGQQRLLERQQQIFDRRGELEPLMVEAFQEVGDYHLVRRHALGNTWWLRQGPTGDARRYWAMAYPRAFPEKVIPLAQEHNVNPYMIWALMLVESSFNPDSLSIANALGLLQVIPRTGWKIAELFGSEDFGPFDLLEEDHSIEQGIFYFSRLVEKFHGQELLAFAGYNGGPHRVGGWLENRGHRIPLDEFIEEIPFDESRGYAKKVLRFLNIYLQIYEGYDDGLYVGQNVRQDYLAQPDF